jgi:hypothetical protein
LPRCRLELKAAEFVVRRHGNRGTNWRVTTLNLP